MAKKYSFVPVIKNKKNFINKYIEYASSMTDAPMEYHEAHAVLLLAIASSGLRLDLSIYPGGINLNMYFIIHGTSYVDRKSTSMNIAKDIQQRAMPGVRLSENFSPGGLETQLADKDGMPSALYVDEFETLIERMMSQQWMIGLKGLMLTMFKERAWTFKKTDKKGKADELVIKDGHLCIIGNVTPAVTERFTQRDIEDGFLGRFVIISSESKPERLKAFGEIESAMRNDVVMHLSKIYQACQACRDWRRKENSGSASKKYVSNIEIEKSALDILDKFQAELESRNDIPYHHFVMVQRLTDAAYRSSCLIALGEVDPSDLFIGPLVVEKKHAIQAVKLCEKWFRMAIRFVGGVGVSKTEQKIEKIILDISHSPGQIMTRAKVMMNNHLTKTFCDEIEMTLLERKQIELVKNDKNNRRR
jgi:hypothetical protein